MCDIVVTLVFALISAGGVDARKFASGISRHSRTLSTFCKIPHAKNNLVDTMTSSHNGGINPHEELFPSISYLAKRARKVREKLHGDDASRPPFVLDPSQLSYSLSTYDMKTNNNIRSRKKKNVVQRGFCNWIIPNKIMIGQYPGMTPETNGPTSNECQLHIQNMVQDAKVTLFCCLQTEVPSQDSDFGWNKGTGGDEVYLEPESLRRKFPRPFTRYGPLAQSFVESQLTFLHHPIEDLSVPTSNDSLLSLLLKLIQHLEIDNHPMIYLHCWGGRGRAGLVGCCLASLIFPELSSTEILNWIQSGYDMRSGAESMHDGLKKSPQTEEQRRFVREFVNGVHSIRETKELVDEFN